MAGTVKGRWRRTLARQLTLEHARTPVGRGGWRPHAGRPHGRTTASHARRPAFTRREPVHVTLRLLRAVGSVRRPATAAIIRTTVAQAHQLDFRIVEFNIVGNHLHLLVEADGPAALARGMQRFNIRLARRLNAHLHRRGPVFLERYHGRPLRTPGEVRAVLRYVLLNFRHHAAQFGRTLPPDWLDPFSSAPWFDGWHNPPPTTPVLARSRPTAPPRTWLLSTGWRRGGPIPIDDVPGPTNMRASS